MLKSIRHMDYVVLLCEDLSVMKDFYNKTMGFPVYLVDRFHNSVAIAVGAASCRE